MQRATLDTPELIASASVPTLLQSLSSIPNPHDPAIRGALLGRLSDVHDMAGGMDACKLVTQRVTGALVLELTTRGGLWSTELDDVAHALEALSPLGECTFDGASLDWWLNYGLPERLAGVLASQLVSLLSYKSDALAAVVLAARPDVLSFPASLVSAPLLAHRPWVAARPWTSGNPPRGAGALEAGVMQTFLRRLLNLPSRTPFACELANAFAGALLATGCPLLLGPLSSTAMQHLTQLALGDGTCHPQCAEGGCGFAWLFHGLAHAQKADVKARFILFDTARALVPRAHARSHPDMIASVMALLGLEDSETEAVVQRALSLTNVDWGHALSAVARHPHAFGRAEVRRACVRNLDTLESHWALAWHTTGDELGDHLRWLLNNDPWAAVQLIQARMPEAVAALKPSDVMPLLRLENRDFREFGARLLHHWSQHYPVTDS